MLAEPRSRLPRTVVLLGFTSLFTDVGTEMIFPLLPVFLTEMLGAGPAYLGLVEGAANTVASLLKLVSGIVADRAKRRKPLVSRTRLVMGLLLIVAIPIFIGLANKAVRENADAIRQSFGQ